MAPERPRVLVILDLADPASAHRGTVHHWDPIDATNELVVLWEAERCPADFLEAAEGGAPSGTYALICRVNLLGNFLFREQYVASQIDVTGVLPGVTTP